MPAVKVNSLPKRYAEKVKTAVLQNLVAQQCAYKTAMQRNGNFATGCPQATS